MKRRFCYSELIAWLVVAIVSLSLYAFAYVDLDRNLYSVYDEGFFFLRFKPMELFTVTTRPLGLGGELVQAAFPSVGDLDVLGLRRLAYGIYVFILILFLVSSCYFYAMRKKVKSLASLFSLVVCELLMGLLCKPDLAINGNHELLYFEMLSMSSCFIAVSVEKNWLKAIAVGLVGFFSYYAILCAAPGGLVLLGLCSLFLVFYGGYEKRFFLLVVTVIAIGVVLAVLVMHFMVISVQDCVGFVLTAISQTTSGGAASHHSLLKVLLVVLFGIRDLIISVTALFGITYLCKLAEKRTGNNWLVVLVGLVLLVVLCNWLGKPKIAFVSIVSWLAFMYWSEIGIWKRPLWNDEMVLFIFLYLLPFGMAVGTNTRLLDKTTAFIIPWGMMLYMLVDLSLKKNRLYSIGVMVLVFVLVFLGQTKGLVLKRSSSEDLRFEQTDPIARMYLTRDQWNYYNEVYGVLQEYGFAGHRDTLLGFCFNEMTIVAMDAVPYTNDQQPEEFLLHDKEKLDKPTFMILSEWDEMVLSSFFESMDWDLQNTYDIIKLKNNPDPNSGWEMTQSCLYCMKTRRLFSENEYEIK